MEEKRLNEKESIELISRMIDATRENVVKGSNGNTLLVYGYSAVILSVIVFVAVKLTGNNAWHALWTAMFIPAIVQKFRGTDKPEVMTYTDSMVKKIWQVCGQLFGLTFIAIPAIGIPTTGMADFSLMLPLCILYYSIGVAMTGLVIKEKLMVWLPLAGFLVAIYMLVDTGVHPTVYWNLWFGVVFFVTGVIPGHAINSKSK